MLFLSVIRLYRSHVSKRKKTNEKYCYLFHLLILLHPEITSQESQLNYVSYKNSGICVGVDITPRLDTTALFLITNVFFSILAEWTPKTLSELCRSEIRKTIRQTINYPEPKCFAEENRKKKRKRRQERRRASRLVVVQRRRSGYAVFNYSVLKLESQKC